MITNVNTSSCLLWRMIAVAIGGTTIDVPVDIHEFKSFNSTNTLGLPGQVICFIVCHRTTDYAIFQENRDRFQSIAGWEAFLVPDEFLTIMFSTKTWSILSWLGQYFHAVRFCLLLTKCRFSLKLAIIKYVAYTCCSCFMWLNFERIAKHIYLRKVNLKKISEQGNVWKMSKTPICHHYRKLGDRLSLLLSVYFRLAHARNSSP